ncbi:alpha/beta fold hydrolase [Lentzea chajnantorensis]
MWIFAWGTASCTCTTSGRAPVFWHHGTPNLGLPPEPLFRPGVRWLSYDRPGYGTSTPLPGRTVASAVTDISHIADELGLSAFAVVGHSGGGPHTLACATLLGDRVTAGVAAACLAPFDATGLDHFAGMIPSGSASLRAVRRRSSTSPPAPSTTRSSPRRPRRAAR